MGINPDVRVRDTYDGGYKGGGNKNTKNRGNGNGNKKKGSLPIALILFFVALFYVIGKGILAKF